jgi:hypothetical protein
MGMIAFMAPSFAEKINVMSGMKLYIATLPLRPYETSTESHKNGKKDVVFLLITRSIDEVI